MTPEFLHHMGRVCGAYAREHGRPFNITGTRSDAYDAGYRLGYAGR